MFKYIINNNCYSFFLIIIIFNDNKKDYFKDLFKYKKAFNVNNDEIKIDKKIFVSGNIIIKKNKRGSHF